MPDRKPAAAPEEPGAAAGKPPAKQHPPAPPRSAPGADNRLRRHGDEGVQKRG